jgi:hypothetical protein
MAHVRNARAATCALAPAEYKSKSIDQRSRDLRAISAARSRMAGLGSSLAIRSRRSISAGSLSVAAAFIAPTRIPVSSSPRRVAVISTAWFARSKGAPPPRRRE